MIRAPFFVGLCCALCAACSSSSDPARMDTAGSCPDVSGTWQITDHCEAQFIGMTLQVTENACALSFAAPFDGFSGSVTADGKITLSGPQSCTGSASASVVSMTCTGDCSVKLER